MFVTSVVQFWTEWGLRISVLTSLAAYTVLSLLSGVRRRSASGGYSILRWAVVLILWVAYQLAEVAATSVLSSLSFSYSDASPEEKQVIAFWGPFLLLHLGGPDNITAYTLEDNMLSLRKPIMMFVHVLWVINAIWNYIYRSRTWVLFAASAIMFVAGVARYAERVCALRRANLDNMQQEDSSKKTEPVGSGASRSSSSSSAADRAVESMITRSLGRELDDDEALLLAQDLFHIWRRALVDSSVDPRSPSQLNSEKLLSLEWSSLCKVAEMELSLMYDILYTKANIAHTWTCACYLIIRFMSPLGTAAATCLFSLYRNKEGRGLIRGSFVLITYLLLGVAFAMDMVWLLRALVSTWTYAFLKNKAWLRPWAWLSSGRWRQLHHAIVCLDPMRLVLGIDPVGYRRWSGTIGRYNLLQECSNVRLRRHPWCRCLVTKIGLEETEYLSEISEGVKKLLFERVKRILPTDNNRSGDAYTRDAIKSCWGQEALRRRKQKLFRWNEEPIFGREFEQDVIVWHIATCIFLECPMVTKVKLEKTSPHVAVIEAMSEYLMFLVAKRPQMLPGLVLHNLLEETRRTLKEIWYQDRGNNKGNQVNLATLVWEKRTSNRDWFLHTGGRRLVLDGAEIAGSLTKYSSSSEEQVLQILELIFNVWVDKLLYAGIRCGRESHAKQLSKGGELTTVLWIIIQHAGPFRIGEEKPLPDSKPDDKKPEEKLKKLEEKKKPEKKPAEEPYLAYHHDPYPYLTPYPYPTPPVMPEPKHEPTPATVAPMPKPSDEKPEKAEASEMPMDPEDAEDYKMPIRYITLY
nr:unnamed protein product [Digitaria exilis]